MMSLYEPVSYKNNTRMLRNLIINRRDVIVVLIASILAFLFLGSYFKNTVTNHHLDTAFLLEIADTTIKQGHPYSKLLSAAVDGSMTWSAVSDDICSSDLAPSTGVYNALDNHAYYAIYAISFVSQVLTANSTLSYLHSFTYVILVFVPYLFLRMFNVSIRSSLLFCLIVTLHFAWSYSSNGDYYMDRYYMPFSLIYMSGMYITYVVQDKVKNYNLLLPTLISGIVAALMTERAAIMLGFSTFAILFIGWKSIRSNRIKTGLIVLGASFLIYAYWYVSVRFVGVSTGGSLTDSTSKLNNLISRFSTYEYIIHLLFYFLINIGVLGIFSVFAGIRVALVAVVSLLPNVIVSVGGAELNGWTTHYHSMYFPVLVFTSMLGFKELSINKYWCDHNVQKAGIITIPFIMLSVIDPYKSSLRPPSLENINGSIFQKLMNYYYFPSVSYERVVQINTKRLGIAVPELTNITITEDSVPSLYQNRNISYYPLGIDTADYAVLNVTYDDNGAIYYKGAISYLGNKPADMLDRCLSARLEAAGYNTQEPVIINNKAVLARSKNILDHKSFSDEMIINNDYSKGLEGWTSVGTVNHEKTGNVTVDVSNYLFQTVKVVENSFYRYSYRIQCNSRKSQYRMQINWYDRDGKLIISDIMYRRCVNDTGMINVDYVSPENSQNASLYVIGGGDEKINVDYVSLRKRNVN